MPLGQIDVLSVTLRQHNAVSAFVCITIILDWFKIYVWRIYTEGTSYVVPHSLESPEPFLFAKNMQSLDRASHLKFCNMWYNERIGEQGSRAKLWQYFFNKSCSEWPDMLYWMSGDPIRNIQSSSSITTPPSWQPKLPFNTSHQSESCF